MATVHSYVRFSTIEQADGDSLRRQLERTIQFCEKHNHTLSDLNLRDLGKSSFRKKNLKNSALATFLELIESGEINEGDILLVEAIDRLSRSGVRTTQEIINKIFKAKVNIAILFPIEQVFEHDSKNQLIDAIVLAAYADLAHQYSMRLSDFGKSWWVSQRKQAQENRKAIAAVIPYWIERDEETFLINEEKANIIRLIYQMAIDGNGGNKIVEYLNGKMIPSPRGKQWNKTYVREVIRQRLTLGEIQFHELDDTGKRVSTGEVLANYYPPIIDEETWIKANAAMDNRTQERGPSGNYIPLFTGLVINVNDDSPANIYSYTRISKGKRKLERRLKSVSAIQKAPGADTATIDLESFEQIILSIVRHLDPKKFSTDKKAEKELQLKLAKLKRIKKSLASMKSDILSGDGDWDFAKNAMKEADIERQDLEDEIRKITAQTSNDMPTKIKQIIALDGQDRIKLREALKSIIENIYILPKKSGTNRRDPIICAIQVVYRTGERQSLIFSKSEGLAGVELPNLESSNDEFRDGLIAQWEELKAQDKINVFINQNNNTK